MQHGEHRGPCPLHIPGFDGALELFVHDDRDQHVSKRIVEEGIWEPYETQLVLQILQAGDCMVDVGANLGYYSVIAASLVGAEGKVFSFEPEPGNFHLLEKNREHNRAGNVECFCAALSDYEGQGSIHLNPDNLGDHQVYDAGEDRLVVGIDLRRGDDIILSATDRVDFIKIDTQGAEFHVLSGLKEVIKRSGHNLHMIVEFWPAGLRRAGASGQQLLDLLTSFNMDMCIIDHLGHTLVPCSRQDLDRWITDVDATEGNEGFINLLLGIQ